MASSSSRHDRWFLYMPSMIRTSAAAALSQGISAGKSPKPLAIRYPNFDSPSTPVSYLPPQSKILQVTNRNPRLGQRLLEESPRPNKTARSPVMSEVKSENPMALVMKENQNSSTIVQSMKFSSPETYLSPGIRQTTPSAEVSPLTSCVKNDPVNEMRHSLSGSFPSATLIKEYQNIAMILEKSDYTMISGKAYIKKSGWRKYHFTSMCLMKSERRQLNSTITEMSSVQSSLFEPACMEEVSPTDGVLLSDVRRNFSNQIMISPAPQRLGPKTGLVKIFSKSVNIEKAQVGFHDDQRTSESVSQPFKPQATHICNLYIKLQDSLN